MKICEKLPKALDGLKPALIYPVLGILGIGIIMNYVIEPVIGTVVSAALLGLLKKNIEE